MNKFKILLLAAIFSLTTNPSTAQAAYELVPKLPANLEDTPSSIPNPKNVLRKLGKSSESSLPRDLNIVVWNLYKGKNATFQKEFLKITQNADLVLAQEMFLDSNMTSTLLSKDRYVYQTATSFFSGRHDVRTGLFTSSKASPLSTKYIRTVNTEPVVNTPKLTLITSYNVDGINRPLLVANIHGINFVGHAVFEEEIKRIFVELKKHKGPIIFAGDFNTWSIERLNTLNLYAKTLNLMPTVFYPDHRMTFNGKKLDQFYHSSDILITSAQAFSEFKGSDHTPLLVQVHILAQ